MATNPSIPEPSSGARQRKRMTPEERRLIVQDTLCRTLQKLDRIMIGTTNLTVQRQYMPEMAAGWTTGDVITLNFAHLEHKSDEDMITIYGLNYHELGHVIMTPRLKGAFITQLEGLHLGDCFNLMEDWRIEVHFAAMFSAAERYFNVMVRQLLIDNHTLRRLGPGREWNLYPIVMGRFYLDPAIRMRYELKFRKKLKGSSRRMELEEAEKVSQIPPGWLVEFEDHFKAAEASVIGYPGMANEYLKLLDVQGDARVDMINALAREFVSRKFNSVDMNPNREMVRLIKKMTVLLPWEGMLSDPAAGLPTKRNAGRGGTLGTDIPMHDSMQDDIDSEEAATEMVAKDKEVSDELRKLAGEHDPDKEEQPPSAEEDDEKPGEDGADGSDDSDAGDSDSEDDNKGEMEAGGGDERSDSNNKIIIDPRQNSEKEEEANKNEEREHSAGHLTGGAGTSDGWEGKDEHLAQLTDEELVALDKMFRDMGVVDQMLTDEVKEILASAPVRRTMYNVRRQIEEALGENLDLESDLDNPYKMVKPAILKERNRLQRQLEELRGQLEGTWRDEQPAGKLNVRRFLNAPRSQYGSLMRSWVADELDAAGIELCLLLDRSSSMASAIDHASQVCWMIGSAVQETEGRVHVISFADPKKDEVLLTPAKKLMYAQYQAFGTYGSTYAAGALNLALKVLQASQMANKVLAIVTDGSWWDMEEAVKVIQKINSLDCDSILIEVGLHMERNNRGCRHVVHANDLNRAALELRRTVERINQNVVRRVSEDRGHWNE